MTRSLFSDWVTEVFGPTVRDYLREKDLPLKVLLVLESAAAHPPNLMEELPVEFSSIKFHFSPPNTTPLLQPIDQQAIANLKKELYTKALFRKCFEATSSSGVTLKQCFSTAGPRPGTGPWHQLYRAARSLRKLQYATRFHQSSD